VYVRHAVAHAKTASFSKGRGKEEVNGIFVLLYSSDGKTITVEAFDSSLLNIN
jgi:hypothetical protein